MKQMWLNATLGAHTDRVVHSAVAYTWKFNIYQDREKERDWHCSLMLELTAGNSGINKKNSYCGRDAESLTSQHPVVPWVRQCWKIHQYQYTIHLFYFPHLAISPVHSDCSLLGTPELVEAVAKHPAVLFQCRGMCLIWVYSFCEKAGHLRGQRLFLNALYGSSP